MKIRQIGTSFFTSLYMDDNDVMPNVNLGYRFPELSKADIQSIGRKISLEEVKRALFAMGPMKAPGPDGLNLLFFQSKWETLGMSLLSKVDLIFENKEEISSVNETNIVLIPKTDYPETIRDFRPISLCNVVYKTLTKVIATRLRRVMPKIISPNQCSFVPGRQGTDNIIVAQEVIHSMRNRKGK